MARTSLAQFRYPMNSGASTTIVFDTISSVAAGSLLVCGWRYEGGTGGVVTGVADTINGSPSGVTWHFYEFSDANRAGVAYCFNHPGGSNVVITVTNNDGSGRAYREGYGVVLSGTVGESDPRSLSTVTSSTSDGTASFAFTMPGDGTQFAMIGSMASVTGAFTPTSPATLVDSLSTPTAYGAAILQFTTGAGSKTIASTGMQSATSHGIAIAFNDPGGGGYTITADSGTYSLAGQDVGLRVARVLTAEHGTYFLAGQDVTLTKETPGAFVLTAESGTYLWTGQDALADYAMNAEAGTYSLAGQDVTFSRTFPQSYSLTVERGTYAWTGRAVQLRWSGAPVVPGGQNKGIYMGMRIGL